MEQVNYEKLLPTSPPDGLIPYLKDKGYFNKEYIIYKAAWVYNPLLDKKERMAECVCSACHEVFHMERMDTACCSKAYVSAPFGFYLPNNEGVINGDSCICPVCGAECEAKHVGSLRYDLDVNVYYPMSVHKVGDRLALVSWRIMRRLSKDGSTRFITDMYEAYVAEDRKLVRLCGYEKYFTTISYSSEWHQKKRYQDTFGEIPPELIYPFDESVLIGTSAENCKLDRYVNCGRMVYPVTYLNLWVKHKNVENLIMQMPFIVGDMVRKLESYYVGMMNVNNIENVNWKEVKPHRMLGISKEAARIAVKDLWNVSDFNFYKRYMDKIRAEDVKIWGCAEFYRVDDIIKFTTNIQKVLRYLEKQKKKYPNQRKCSYVDLTDYWKMSKKLGDNLRDENIMWPQNLIRAHDIATFKNMCIESPEIPELFVKRSEVLDRFIYEDDTFIIRPAHSSLELIEEGSCLSHCVGSYAEDHANGETAIFFIRFKAEPDVSYFTLELDEENLTVRQNRGRGNCSRTEEVKAFEEKWLKHIKELKKKESKKNGKRNNKCTSGAA